MEIKGLQKVQKDQGKALEKFQDTGVISPLDYKNLIDELKHTKETLRLMEDRQRKDEKNHKSQFDHMMKLEDKIKQLQQQTKQTVKLDPESA